MSVFNFSLAMYCFLTLDRGEGHNILNLANLHKTYLFELGDYLLKLTFLARFYIIYLTVWIFCQQQKDLYKQFIDADFYLGELKTFSKGHRNSSSHFIVYIRLLAFICCYVSTVTAHAVHASMGCQIYNRFLTNPKVIIAGMILVASGLAALFDISCSLAFVQSRFDVIQDWLLQL